MNLSRIVYYSERNQSASLDLRSLIETCHKNNSARSISGLLHFNGTYFLQVLEGARGDISDIYHRIAGDNRHTNLILISVADARERIFPTWSMGLHEGVDEKSRDVFLRYFSKERIDPETVNVDSLLDVLQDLSSEMH
ncbi:MAG: BLUF domain-containing protein [Pseudomonadota bacterium]